MRATDRLVQDFVGRLHEGRERPYNADYLAADMGIPYRVLQQLVEEAINRGYLIGSSCRAGASGYFLIRPGNEEDLRFGTGHIVARAKASLARVSKLRRAAEKQRFGTEALQLFDVEEAVPA